LELPNKKTSFFLNFFLALTAPINTCQRRGNAGALRFGFILLLCHHLFEVLSCQRAKPRLAAVIKINNMMVAFCCDTKIENLFEPSKEISDFLLILTLVKSFEK
jgi:hypothetical protein